MKHIICIGLTLILLVTAFCGCNKKAIISLPNGEIIEGEVESWKDFDDGDQIQVVIDGKTYLIHSSQIVMIAE